MPTRPKPEGRLVALFGLGLLLLNYPLLSIFGRGTVGGLPTPFLYLLGVWAALILLLSRLADPKA